MTQEEKAKAYDEAIKRAKGVIEQNPLMEYLKKGIEYILPELKESEDERIRKSIIENLKGNMCRTDGDYDLLNKQIAWLEKQHMQKQETNYPKFDFDDILAIHCCMKTAEKVTEDKELYEKLKSLHSRLYDAYQLEKQGNQKFAEWNKEDKAIVLQIEQMLLY